MSKARDLALQQLLDSPRGKKPGPRRALPPPLGGEGSIARELVQGVHRNLFLIDAILRPHLKSQVSEVPTGPRELLRLGVHDLLFRSHLPAPIVVAETVEIAGKAKARGFVNAVLRRVSEAFEILPGRARALDRSCFDVSAEAHASFRSPILPDPLAEPVKWHSVRYSLLEPFVARLCRLLPLEFEEYFRSTQAKLKVAVRPTDRVQDRDALKLRLESEGASVVRDDGIILELRLSSGLVSLPSFQQGLIAVQDHVASEVATFAAVRRGARVLDLCAPPGGKALHLAELVSPEGHVVAAYRGEKNVQELRQNLERVAQKNISLHDLGPEGGNLPKENFDLVLVDAPCSNSGVLMKRVEARYRLAEKEVKRLGELQLKVLGEGASRVRPGGSLVYSTCSILPEENEAVVLRFLAMRPGFLLSDQRLRYPHRTRRDGGFMARLTLVS